MGLDETATEIRNTMGQEEQYERNGNNGLTELMKIIYRSYIKLNKKWETCYINPQDKVKMDSKSRLRSQLKM